MVRPASHRGEWNVQINIAVGMHPDSHRDCLWTFHLFIIIGFLMVRPASQRGEWNDLNKHFGWYDAYLMIISCRF